MDGDVTIRPIRPDDWRRLQEFHLRLSPEAIRLRFHAYLRELPDDMAHRFCEVDGYVRVAFVAVSGAPERIVGVGRYDRVGTEVAEMAFVVEDAYQRKGIGTTLLNHLLQRARTDGAKTFLARVLPGNTPMRHLLEKTGCPIRTERGFHGDADLLWLALS